MPFLHCCETRLLGEVRRQRIEQLNPIATRIPGGQTNADERKGRGVIAMGVVVDSAPTIRATFDTLATSDRASDTTIPSRPMPRSRHGRRRLRPIRRPGYGQHCNPITSKAAVAVDNPLPVVVKTAIEATSDVANASGCREASPPLGLGIITRCIGSGRYVQFTQLLSRSRPADRPARRLRSWRT
jgi:hypothetical protein